MNRQEALKKLQEYYDWNFDDEEYDESNDIYNEQNQNIEDLFFSLTDKEDEKGSEE